MRIIPWHWWALPAVVLWCATGRAEQPEDSPLFEREEAYRLIRRADDAQHRNDWAAAVQDYAMAQAIYRTLRDTAPNWEQDYFQFRIDDSERKLRLIEQRTDLSRDEWMEREPRFSPARVERYRVLYHALRRENEQLRQRIAALEADLELLLEMEELERDRRRTRMDRDETEPDPAVHDEDQGEGEESGNHRR